MKLEERLRLRMELRSQFSDAADRRAPVSVSGAKRRGNSSGRLSIEERRALRKQLRDQSAGGWSGKR
ncbi:MAG: hypothetical protein H6934_00420 [Burkholderiaceae bacterium]|nr:hypothetical protein [Burkholderiaceae bacterium]